MKIRIEDVPALAGDYEFDPAVQLNGHELHLIKQVAGLRIGEIEEAAAAMDYDLTICLAVISMWRAGKIQKQQLHTTVDLLMSAPGGKIHLLDEEPEGDASPPPEPPAESLPSASQPSGESSDSSPATIPDVTGSPV